MSEEFFALVHRHVTPAMAQLGYACIGDIAAPARSGAEAKLTAGRRWARIRARRARVGRPRGTAQVLSVGYEHATGDERWLYYSRPAS